MVRALATCTLIGLCGTARAAPPDYDFQFSTVGATNNPAYAGPDLTGVDLLIGRGSVPYEYRVSKLEVTTAQWLEFENTFTAQKTLPPFLRFGGPTYWGAEVDPSYSGPGFKYKLRNVASAATFPVGGISWREAALYCNWLHNGKQASNQSLMDGAYDVSTFGDQGFNFTDALTHRPDAKYWIPTIDEAMKAAHYDPNRYGAGQGGWWLNKNKSDDPGVPGPPGTGSTSGGWEDPNSQRGEWDIPLGSYPQSLSPWGLLDTSGGAKEWTEFVFYAPDPEERGLYGSAAGEHAFDVWDHTSVAFSNHPGDAFPFAGLRIASAVPSPASFGVVSLVFLVGRRSDRRTHDRRHCSA